jgi:hypothetical protein
MSSTDSATTFDPTHLEGSDAQDASRTLVELMRAESPLAWGPVIVSGVLLLMAAAIFAAVAFRLLPDNSLVAGAAITWVTAVVSYWIGSSAGSRRMGDAVRSIAVGAAAPSSARLPTRPHDADG